jgi:6-phosphogluconolactonase (cycloisomerase 2 family)
VVDKGKNSIGTFAVQPSGALKLQSSAGTGNQPSALALDGDNFLYVTNSTDSTVTGYSVASGTLTRTSTNASDTQPVAITVDPRHIGYLYTVNFLGGSISGYQINKNDGTLINTKLSPYPSNVQPTAIAGIPHGGTTAK